MSNLTAFVSDIESCDNLHIIKFKTKSNTLTMMSLDISNDIKINTKVKLSVKPSSIAIAKGINSELSYSNQISCKIISCDIGELLTSIEVQFDAIVLESIITTSSAKRMNLKVNDDVVILIKASELSIKEIIND